MHVYGTVERNGNNNFKGPYKFYDRCKTAPVFREVENDETRSMLCSDGAVGGGGRVYYKICVVCIMFYFMLLVFVAVHNFIISYYTHYTSYYYVKFYLVCTYLCIIIKRFLTSEKIKYDPVLYIYCNNGLNYIYDIIYVIICGMYILWI